MIRSQLSRDASRTLYQRRHARAVFAHWVRDARHALGRAYFLTHRRTAYSGFGFDHDGLRRCSRRALAREAFTLAAFSREPIPAWYPCGRADAMGDSHGYAAESALILRRAVRLIHSGRVLYGPGF